MTATATATRTLTAAIYARRSRLDDRQGRSVGEQETECREVCAAEGWAVGTPFVDDGRSASRFAKRQRESWPLLLDGLRAGRFSVLVLWESNRGERKLAGWAELLDLCRDLGVLIHVVSHERTYDVRRARDWKALADDGVESAHASELTSKAVRRGVRGVVVEGKPTGRTPYGYRRRYWLSEDGVRQVAQEPDPQQAPVVVEIIRRVARGEAVSIITADLNRREVPAANGGEWTRGTVRKLALSVTYVARRLHRGKVHDGNWAPLVAEEEWAAARAVLTAEGRTTTRPGKARWLLSRIMTCPTCPAKKSGLEAHPARGTRSAYYACPTGHAAVDAAAADAYVTLLVFERLADPAYYARLTASDDAAATAARRAAATLRARLDSHYEEAAEGKLSAGGLSAVERKLLPRIEEADREATTVAVPLALRELVGAGARVEELRSRWERMPVAARRSVLRTLFARLELSPLGRPGRRGDSDPAVVATRLTVLWHGEDVPAE